MKGRLALAYGVLAALLVLCVRMPEVERFLVTTAGSYLGSTSDGYVFSYSGSYTTARATSNACVNAGIFARVGQAYYGGTYEVYRGYLDFDTSAIPDDAIVISATLRVTAAADVSTQDFVLGVYDVTWTEDLSTNREANFDLAVAPTLLGSIRDTASGWVSGTVYSVDLSPAIVNVSGDTKLALLSDRERAATSPSGNEMVDIFTADYTGTGKDPVLEVGYEVPTPTPTDTETPTDTPTPTATATDTPTPTNTPTPTVTAICPVAITSNTTWGPGTVRVDCNVGVQEGKYLTVTAGTDVVMVGDWRWDVWGNLYAVGTAAQPITLTSSPAITWGEWGPVWVRQDGSAWLERVRLQHGRGLNDQGASWISYTEILTNTAGLWTLSGTQVQSSTLQGNDVGIYVYFGASPGITYCNVVDNVTWDVQMSQSESVSMVECWWGAAPPSVPCWMSTTS